MVSALNLKPRIAFTTTVYDHTSVGGGTFVHYLRQAVEDGKLDIVFFSDDIGEALEVYERPVRIPAWARRLPGGWLTRSYFFHKAVQADHSIRPFVMIWHNNVITSLFDVALPCGVPVIGMVNDYSNAESRSPLASRRKYGTVRAFIRYGWQLFEKWAARRVDHLIVNSEYMAERIGSAYKIDEHRIHLLYKGVDLEEFEYVPLRSFSQPIKILFVKLEFIRAGLPDLLAAIADFPVRVQLTVIGPPPQSHDAIRAMAEPLGVAELLNISGPIGRDEITGIFRDHDILCIPSRSEALGVAFMEALACGLPAVGTRVGGVPEVLDHGRAGWLAEPGVPASIRGALLDVIENDEERKKRVMHGRKHVTRFSHENMIDEMNVIARTVVESSEVSEPCV